MFDKKIVLENRNIGKTFAQIMARFPPEILKYSTSNNFMPAGDFLLFYYNLKITVGLSHYGNFVQKILFKNRTCDQKSKFSDKKF